MGLSPSPVHALVRPARQHRPAGPVQVLALPASLAHALAVPSRPPLPAGPSSGPIESIA